MHRLTPLLVSSRCRWWPWAVLLLCAFAGLAQAQSSAEDNQADPPSRVARLSYLSGNVGLLGAGANEWYDASLNRPMTSGDQLSTGNGARAELELGGSAVRIDGLSDIGVLDLDDELAQIELTRGSLSLSVRQLEPGQNIEIDTPAVALVVDRPGLFRVDINADGRGVQITVQEGAAMAYGDNGAERHLAAGRRYQIADSSLAAVAISEVQGGDVFDAWSRERDRRYAQSTTREYVSDDVVGYHDLDEYGDWQDNNDYGAVWYPRQVAADWAPYRDGRWSYIAPWGWTWVDDSPWGYAPYHYGRWAYTPRGWGWIPGPRGVRAVYAPALVAFVGGGGWSVGVGGTPVGWFPLGPHEVYNPWYRASRHYYTNINITNIRLGRGYDAHRLHGSISNQYGYYNKRSPMSGVHYVNREAPRGFTAVGGRTFASGGHVQRSLLRVDPRQSMTATVLPRGIDMRPATRHTGPRNAYAQTLPAGGFNRGVVARRAPTTNMFHRRDVSDTTGGAAPGANRLDPRVRVLNSPTSPQRRPTPSTAARSGIDQAVDAQHATPAYPSNRNDRRMATPDRVTPVRAGGPIVERRTTTEPGDSRNSRLQPSSDDTRMGEDPGTMRDDRNALSRRPARAPGSNAASEAASDNRQQGRGDIPAWSQTSRPGRVERVEWPAPNTPSAANMAADRARAAAEQPVAAPRPAPLRPERTDAARTYARPMPAPWSRPETSRPTPAPQQPAAKPSREAPRPAAAPTREMAAPPTIESREKPPSGRPVSTRKDKRDL